MSYGRLRVIWLPVSSLLDKYTRALDAIRSFTDTCEEACDHSNQMPDGSKMVKGTRFSCGQHRADGVRLYMRNYSWGDFRSERMDLPRNKAHYHLRIEANKKFYGHSTAVNDPRVRGTAYLQPATRDPAAVIMGTYSGIYGCLGVNERLDAVLRGAKWIAVRPTTETINGVACHVIDSHTQYGQYTVWLDPAHGYHAAKVTRNAKGGHKESRHLVPKGGRASASWVVSRFEKVGDVWVPVEADQETAYTSGKLFRRSRSHYKRANIVLNPDHDELGSFDIPLENPANDPELKEGTRVRIILPNPPTIKAAWKNGKAIDEAGQIVDISQLWANTELQLKGQS